MTDSVSSTTSSSTTTTSSSSTGSTILSALGADSGIDTSTIVDELVSAEYDTKTTALTTQYDTLTSQISAASELLSGITNFSSSLTTLIQGGTLSTQPTSSNESIVTVSTVSGGSAAGLSSTVEVRQLAQGQVSSSTAITDASTTFGTGSLTITFGTATVDDDGNMTDFTAGDLDSVTIDITDDNNTLAGIAQAINDANPGVTASVVTDEDGSRLVLKSANGSSHAFTVTATEDSDATGLSALNVGVGATGTTIGSAAQDAIVSVDGVVLRRSSNTLTDVISGVKLTLLSASAGTKVTLSSEEPTDALQQAVNDFVSTYNELLSLVQTDTDSTDGVLKSDSAAKQLARSLAKITSTVLTTGQESGAPTTLAELGVSTNRDGTLTVDSSKLSAALINYPGAVEAMFVEDSGLDSVLSGIATTASDDTYGLAASEDTYTDKQTEVTDEQADLEDEADNMRTRLTQQFASMTSKVSSYQSIQSFLEQQIDAWNSSDN